MDSNGVSESKPLNVAIVGAGLAGALAARVLREKHNVTLYERSRGPVEVGAAINVGPNGVRILDTLGFDRSLAGSMPVGATKVYNKEGKLTLEKYPKYFDEYGADWLFHHRADLRTEFLRLATIESSALDISGSPAAMRWGCEITQVDPDSGKLVLSSGEEIEADLVIAGDGIKSVIRPEVVGDAAFSTARPSGLSAFRFTIEASTIKEAYGELPEVLNPEKPVCLLMMLAFDGTKRTVVMYPCRQFKILNLVCICPDENLKEETTESWSAPGDREELLSIFSDFANWTLDLFKLADNIKLWQLRDQDPLPSYIRGRTVLIGDAAHSMTPHQGQGGTQAVEDAEGFRLFLKPGITKEDVPVILKDFDSVRRPRASQIQDNTRKAVERRTAEDIYRFEKYNWTYPGIVEGLRRVKAGEELIQIPEQK